MSHDTRVDQPPGSSFAHWILAERDFDNRYPVCLMERIARQGCMGQPNSRRLTRYGVSRNIEVTLDGLCLAGVVGHEWR
jgi:hypothetical protein